MNFFTPIDRFALSPAIVLAMFGCAVFLFDFLVPRTPKGQRYHLAYVVLGLGCTGWALFNQQAYLGEQHLPEIAAFSGALVIDRLSLFFNWIFLIASLIVSLVSYKLPRDRGRASRRILWSDSAGQLRHVLPGRRDRPDHAVCRPRVDGAVLLRAGRIPAPGPALERSGDEVPATGRVFERLLVYGFSVLYGLSGSTRLRDIALALEGRGLWDPLVFLALATTTVGLLFKIAAVPFHMWAPDAYEGAPTPITAYLSVARRPPRSRSCCACSWGRWRRRAQSGSQSSLPSPSRP